MLPTRLLNDRNADAGPSGNSAGNRAILPDPGVAIVPDKPTATMLAAGARAGGVTVEAAWRVYQAMIRERG